MHNHKKIWIPVAIVIAVILVIFLGTVFFAQYAAVDNANGLPYSGVALTSSDTVGMIPGVPVNATSTIPPRATSTPITEPLTPFKAYLTPISGQAGTVVTIHGSGFGASNTVTMNGMTSGSLKNVASQDGHTLMFTVPEELGPNCKAGEMCAQFMMLLSPNTYQISVITGDKTQNIGTFTVSGQPLVP